MNFPRTIARAGLAAAIATAATFGTAQAEDWGARVGEAIPHQREAPDQTNQVQSFVTLKKNRWLIMLFSRSLAWWPTCISQAVAWNDRIDFIHESGFEVVSMTYDDVDTLKRFAARRGIKYPLLADAKREAIRAFRLFNDGPPPESLYYGTSTPQVVVVNADGVVTRTFSGHSYPANEEIEGIMEHALQGSSS